MNDESDRLSQRGKYPEVGVRAVRLKIGEELRSAREFKQLTIEQVSAVTKVNTRFIDSIEKGNWSFLPPTYVKAFIYTLAETVGLETEKIEARIDEIFSEVTAAAIATKSVSAEEVDGGFKPSDSFIWSEHRSMIFYGLLVVVVLILIVIFLRSPHRSNTPLAESLLEGKRGSISTIVGDAQSDTAGSPLISKETTPEKPEPQPVTETYPLEIYAVDTCYVKIMQGDSIIYERTLWPRNRIRKKLDNIVKLSLGNAPGVRLIVNHDTLPAFPRGRRVRVVRLNGDGFVR